MPIGKHNGVGRVGHGQQEGEGRAEGGGDQDVQRVDVDGLSLETEITEFLYKTGPTLRDITLLSRSAA